MKTRPWICATVSLVLITCLASDAVGQRQRGAGRGRQAANAQPENSKRELPQEWADQVDWRSIGPANMGGRITSIAVYEADPAIWYVATASGGLLKTENNGQTFEHLFDDQATVSIGDVQVCQSDPNLVWIGTGEANPRNSVSWGNGVYKSTDGGKTWENMGLEESFQTGRIAIHPDDPNVVLVGALGRLWGPNEQRGLFRTTDGGKKWEKVLFVDDMTGIIDVKFHPKDAEIVLAATYERQRDGFDGNDPGKKYGEGSGLYRSTDGGKSFERVTEGLPSCKLGRIGIDWYRKNPNVVYALVESEKIASVPENAPYAGLSGENAEVGAKITDVIEDGPAAKGGLQIDDIVIEVDGQFVADYQSFLGEMRRHVAGDKVKLLVVRDREEKRIEVELDKREVPTRRDGTPGNSEFTGTLGGQAANLQGQQGIEGEEEYGGLYMSTDAGVSWKRINTLNPRPMYYSQVRVDPSNKKYIYILGTSLWRSSDGGETFTGDGGNGVHSDNHAMWIDPRNGEHMVLGCDGGIYETWNRMDNWQHHNNVAIGQFYHVGVDNQLDYKVYGGLQDNGSWGAPVHTQGSGPRNSDWFRVGGGDGFIVLVDEEDPDQIYYESQNGAMQRINFRTGDRGFIRPRPPRGTQYRFNWKTPFILSPHNSRIHYSAGNYVFRSLSQGDGVEAISPEITNSDEGAGSAISESPLTAGVLYVGTTDGAVWVTRDGGETWEEIFVQRVESEDEDEGDDEDGEKESGESEESESATGETSQSDAEKSAEGSEATDEPSLNMDEQAEAKESSEKAEGDKPERDSGDKEAEAREAARAKAAEERAKAAEARAEARRKRQEAREMERKKREEAEKADRGGESVEPVRPESESEREEMKAQPDRREQRQQRNERANPERRLANALVGSWEGVMNYDALPEDERWIKMNVTRGDDGTLKGTFKTPRSVSQLENFEFTPEDRAVRFDGRNSITDVVFELQFTRAGRLAGKIIMGDRLLDIVLEKPDESEEQEESAEQSNADGVPATLIGYRNAAGDSGAVSAVMKPIQQEDDPVSGVWKNQLLSDEIPDGEGEFEIRMTLGDDGAVTGQVESPMGMLELYDGRFQPENGKVRCRVSNDEAGFSARIVATIADNKIEGQITIDNADMVIDFVGERTEKAKPEAAEPEATAEEAGDAQESESEATEGGRTRQRRQRGEAGQRGDAPRGRGRGQRGNRGERQEDEASAESGDQETEGKSESVTASDDDPVTGTWEGRFIAEFMRGDRANLKIGLRKLEDGSIKGWYETSQANGSVVEGKYESEEGQLFFVGASDQTRLLFSGKLADGRVSGTVEIEGRDFSFEFEAQRKSTTFSMTEGDSEAAEEPAGPSLAELVPGPRWVSSIEASKHSTARVYLTLDGHRSNDDEPYVFMSNDYGKSWESIRGNLPKSAGTTRVIREDYENPDLLFLGCEFSAWVSIDRGQSWTRLQGGLPTVAVHEFAMNRATGEVVAGTHGRSLWVADATVLRKLRREVLEQDAALLQPNHVIRWSGNKSFGEDGMNGFRGESADDNAEIYYHIGKEADRVLIEISNLEGEVIARFNGEGETGLHQIDWNLQPNVDQDDDDNRGRRRFRRRSAESGRYLITLTVDDREYRKTLEIKDDPNAASQSGRGTELDAEFEELFRFID